MITTLASMGSSAPSPLFGRLQQKDSSTSMESPSNPPGECAEGPVRSCTTEMWPCSPPSLTTWASSIACGTTNS
ncbi:hypothetical protein J4Q44_G00044680 [Coregonus suidteri]|uniref:Uncharacterized protein n=1 Tax=Coregonus suidteri TaxID=861788 RepID=A0AAN8NDD4_9TELE